jgi:hypothetical protein
LPESGWVGAAVPPGSVSLLPEVGVVGCVTIFTDVESSPGAGVEGGGVVAVVVSTGVVSVGGVGGATVVVGAVVVSTGVVGVAGGWVLGSWVDSVVTSVTG